MMVSPGKMIAAEESTNIIFAREKDTGRLRQSVKMRSVVHSIACMKQEALA